MLFLFKSEVQDIDQVDATQQVCSKPLNPYKNGQTGMGINK
ncbi:MAG: hypothetical protein ACJASL_002347 [Paraglaciecola sp.]|jgi:hypothetical protein